VTVTRASFFFVGPLTARMERYVALEKYKARGATDICPIKKQWCDAACKRCVDCKDESRDWSDCWSWCDECQRCEAAAMNERSYNEPYFHTLRRRTLGEVPAIAKQVCDNVCGVNVCKAYGERRQAYNVCRRSGSTDCERKYGCPNPNGIQFGYVLPKDPMFTDCKVCWQ
jgi:hypothetical protein